MKLCMKIKVNSKLLVYKIKSYLMIFRNKHLEKFHYYVKVITLKDHNLNNIVEKIKLLKALKILKKNLKNKFLNFDHSKIILVHVYLL